MARAFRLLAPLKVLRGTPFDPFGYAQERRMERALIKTYERDLDTHVSQARPDQIEALVALAELPLAIRGFGPVKAQNAARAETRRAEILAHLKTAPGPTAEAAE